MYSIYFYFIFFQQENYHHKYFQLLDMMKDLQEQFLISQQNIEQHVIGTSTSFLHKKTETRKLNPLRACSYGCGTSRTPKISRLSKAAWAYVIIEGTLRHIGHLETYWAPIETLGIYNCCPRYM